MRREISTYNHNLDVGRVFGNEYNNPLPGRLVAVFIDAIDLPAVVAFSARPTQEKMGEVFVDQFCSYLSASCWSGGPLRCGSDRFLTLPQKSYTLTVTATSAAAGASPSVSQSTTVKLIVQ
jgi:hypothetical protein